MSSKLDELTIADIKQLKEMFGDQGSQLVGATAVIPTTDLALGWSIVILDRGHVLVGDVTVKGLSGGCGGWIETRNASVVRIWGTTRGLGQIAREGPTTETVLDPIGVIRSPINALIGVVDCDETKWPQSRK